MRTLWRQYPSTVLSVVFLVLAGVYGWFDARSELPVLGAFDDAGYEQSVVLAVPDGQSLELENGTTVQLAGVQAPSLHQDAAQSECYAIEAQQLLSQLALNKVVLLEKSDTAVDKYGRPERYVWIQDLLLNHELVLQGAAVVFDPNSDLLYTDTLLAAERAARVQAKGLWRECSSDASSE